MLVGCDVGKTIVVIVLCVVGAKWEARNGLTDCNNSACSEKLIPRHTQQLPPALSSIHSPTLPVTLSEKNYLRGGGKLQGLLYSGGLGDVVMSTPSAAAGPSAGPTEQLPHVFAPYLPRAGTGRSARFVQHDDAVVAAVDALDVNQLLALLDLAGTIPFWRCMRSLCHAYPTQNPLRWEQMAALMLHTEVGTWRSGQPLPTERPQLKTGPGVMHLDNPLSSGVNEALLDDDRWDVKAFRVLLSLGVPFVDYLVWDELLERAASLKEHLCALADHFGKRLFSQEDILERLEESLLNLTTCDSAEDFSHEMEATTFLMRILFRWYLGEISVEAGKQALAPLREALDLESLAGSALASSSSAVGSVPSAPSLEDLLEQVFRSLAKEGSSIVHMWCPKLELPCRDLLCQHAHSRKQLLLRNPLLRF
jgi:hypothetical protein